MRIEKEFSHLIRDDSRFWVVRPRITGTTVSGLRTILSGYYIALDPGEKGGSKRQFVGLEQPPLTPSSVPGLRIKLNTDKPGSIHIGSKLVYQGSQIGKIESRHFDNEKCMTTFGVFIEQRFASLINEETKFWQDNGLKLAVGAYGFKLNLPSIETLISGQIKIGTPKVNGNDLSRVGNQTSFTLFNDEEEANASNFVYADEFIILADQSVRGLGENAPVEFRGLPIGKVVEVSFELTENSPTRKIPILIQLDKTLMKKHFPLGLKDDKYDFLELATKRGLKASLQSGSLITGKLVVDLDYYPDTPAEAISTYAGYKVLPSAISGFARLEDRLAAALAKFNDLPVEPLLTELRGTSKEGTAAIKKIHTMLADENGIVAQTQETIKQAKATLKSLDTILKSEEVNKIPADLRASLVSLQKILNDKDVLKIPEDLRTTLSQLKVAVKPFSPDGNVHGDLLRTLEEIRAAVRSIERTSKAIGDKPNSLLFGKDKSSKEIPRANP